MKATTEKRDDARRAAAGREAPASRDRAGMPRSSPSPARDAGRCEVKNPLGDFSEQTGALFG